MSLNVKWIDRDESLLLSLPFDCLSVQGHVESNEDDKQTALREVQEEAGYTEKDLLIYDDIIKKLNYKSGKNDKTVVYFLAELKDVKKQPKLSHEHTEYRWLAKDEAISTSRFATYAELFNYFDEKIENLWQNLFSKSFEAKLIEKVLYCYSKFFIEINPALELYFKSKL